MKEYLKIILRDVYEGIYFLSRKYESQSESLSATHLRFIITFFTYYLSLLLLALAIKVVTYGPFKLNAIEAIVYIFGGYAGIYKFFIFPLLDTSKVDENIDISTKKRKIRKSILAQIIGISCIILAFLIAYFLYKK